MLLQVWPAPAVSDNIQQQYNALQQWYCILPPLNVALIAVFTIRSQGMLLQVRPAPAVPDDIQQQYDALQQCMLVLRRAHLTGKPDEPVKALASAGLVDMETVRYQDVCAGFDGIGDWLQYVEVGSTLRHDNQG